MRRCLKPGTVESDSSETVSNVAIVVKFRRGILLMSTLAVLAACGPAGFVLAGCGPGGDGGAVTDTTDSTDTSTDGTAGTTEENGTTSTDGTTGNILPTTDTTGADGATTALLSFELELVGPVTFADRYSVNLSINGDEEVHGFCGFADESTRCLATEYDWLIPSVELGANLSWFFTVVAGSSTFNFAQAQDVTFAPGMRIAAKCLYRDSVPECQRIVPGG